LETILQDLAYGARILKKSPAFTAVIVFTLALGIGANTAIFSIVQAVLLRPLPYRDPSRLVLTFDAPVHDQESKIFVPYRHFLEWKSKSHSYADMAAETWARGARFMLGCGAPQSILAIPVSVDLEIGIRMALGAQASDVLHLVMKQGMLLAGVGAGLGLLAALWLGNLLRSLLYGVRPQDPATLGGVSLVLILAALVATYIPARRATRVNPIDSLRSE
jgi:hypothetical protein